MGMVKTLDTTNIDDNMATWYLDISVNFVVKRAMLQKGSLPFPLIESLYIDQFELINPSPFEK